MTIGWRDVALFSDFNFISEIYWQEQPTEGGWSNPRKVGATNRRQEQPTEGVPPPPLIQQVVGIVWYVRYDLKRYCAA